MHGGLRDHRPGVGRALRPGLRGHQSRRDAELMDVAELRRRVRAQYPHVKISVRTINFVDLMRESRKCLTIEGDRSAEEVQQINAWAKEAGIVPDGSIRGYQMAKYF